MNGRGDEVEVPLRQIFSKYDKDGCGFLVTGGASVEAFRQSSVIMHGSSESAVRHVLALEEHQSTTDWLGEGLDESDKRVRRIDIETSPRSRAMSMDTVDDDSTIRPDRGNRERVITSPATLQRALRNQIEELEEDVTNGFHGSQLRVSIHRIDSLVSDAGPKDVAMTLIDLHDEITDRNGRLYVHLPIDRADETVERIWQLVQPEFDALLDIGYDASDDALYHTYEIPPLGEYGPVEM